MAEWVLVDGRGRVLTDREGFARIWFTHRQATKDAEDISPRLGRKVRPKLLTIEEAYLPIPEGRRIEL